ncbi:hypothetical protein [Micromonospora sp. IBSANI012]|uniref:hypothetical protein n=1 Tax=Micromonospora sp. IBSANI012 TaxID=3457761 RepID=UPI0040594C5D
MTQQHESRWSLSSTGNRVLLAVVVGLVVGWLGSVAGLTGAAHVLVFVVTAGLTYALVTLLHRSRR